eukprot:709277-Prorocentrum_minimum.AAC.1
MHLTSSGAGWCCMHLTSSRDGWWPPPCELVAMMASSSALKSVVVPPVAAKPLKTWAHVQAKKLPTRQRGKPTVVWSMQQKEEWPSFRKLVPEASMLSKPDIDEYNAYAGREKKLLTQKRLVLWSACLETSARRELYARHL